MPYIALDPGIENVAVGLWRISETEDYFLSRLTLYENEVRRLGAISHPMSRLEWLSSRLCMKELLKVNHQVESLNHMNGKPYLSDHSHHISYSHSSIYSAAIASKEKNVAIDLEYLKRNRNLETRYLFMNDEELQQFDEFQHPYLFFLIWSSKETLYKIYGKRGIAFRHNLHVDVKNFDFKPNGMIPGIVQENDLFTEYEIQYHLFSEFILTYTAAFVREPEVGSAC